MPRNALFVLKNRKNLERWELRPSPTPLPPAGEDFAWEFQIIFINLYHSH